MVLAVYFHRHQDVFFKSPTFSAFLSVLETLAELFAIGIMLGLFK